MAEVTPGQRVLLGTRDPSSWRGFRWTGDQPASLKDEQMAVDFGAVWEGDELVTYDLPAMAHLVDHLEEPWLPDSD